MLKNSTTMSLQTMSVIEFAPGRKRLQAKGKAAVKQPILRVSIVSVAVLGWVAVARAQHLPTELGRIYADESHCLVAPEIRSVKDSPISCQCRDAIADARYVHSTYILTGKDRNLTRILLALQRYAGEMCSRDAAEALEPDFISKIHAATMEKNWKWDGPEVVRTYPPDEVIRQIKPDSRGMISVQYTVVILQRDSQGQVTRSESFSAVDRILPALLKPEALSQTRRPRKAPQEH
jgi:hypothetical protein